jgi:hypothetical protein
MEGEQLHSASIINRDRSVGDSATFFLCCSKGGRVALPPLPAPLIDHEPFFIRKSSLSRHRVIDAARAGWYTVESI